MFALHDISFLHFRSNDKLKESYVCSVTCLRILLSILILDYLLAMYVSYRENQVRVDEAVVMIMVMVMILIVYLLCFMLAYFYTGAFFFKTIQLSHFLLQMCKLVLSDMTSI